MPGAVGSSAASTYRSGRSEVARGSHTVRVTDITIVISVRAFCTCTSTDHFRQPNRGEPTHALPRRIDARVRRHHRAGFRMRNDRRLESCERGTVGGTRLGTSATRSGRQRPSSGTRSAIRRSAWRYRRTAKRAQGNARTDFGAKIASIENGLQFAMPVNFGFNDANGYALEGRRGVDALLDGRVGNTILVRRSRSKASRIPAGSARYNQALSERRAVSVRNYLMTKGMTNNQLNVVGYGKTRQVAPGAWGDTPGAEQNRRVVFVIETRPVEGAWRSRLRRRQHRHLHRHRSSNSIDFA